MKLMTGKYNFRNYSHFGYLNPKEKTFGQMLQSAGYKTAIAGKWQLNGLYHGAEGHDDNTRPFKAGFDEYCLWQVTTGTKIKDGGGERFWSPPLEQNGKFLTIEDNAGKYGPDIMSDFLCDFIRKNKGQPFFVYYPTTLVHNPFVQLPIPLALHRGHRPPTISRKASRPAKPTLSQWSITWTRSSVSWSNRSKRSAVGQYADPVHRRQWHERANHLSMERPDNSWRQRLDHRHGHPCASGCLLERTHAPRSGAE